MALSRATKALTRLESAGALVEQGAESLFNKRYWGGQIFQLSDEWHRSGVSYEYRALY